MPERRRESGQWVVIAEEPEQISAEMLVQYLRSHAIPARLAAADAVSFLGPSPFPTRVLVPKEWEHDALVTLERHGDDEGQPPGAGL